jgi:xanthine/uracil/vitamin C permease (AzgA family)
MFMSRVSVLIPDFVLAKIMITVGLMMMMHGRVMTSRAS